MNEIEKLFYELEKLKPFYDENMSEVLGGIKRTAFFPGGNGVFSLIDFNISNKEIMILGQDFDTKLKYESAKKNESEDISSNTTWKNLLCLLNEAKISPDNCFFTNAIMGVRNNGSAIGKSPGFKNKIFIDKCQEFFLYQLEMQKPKIILVLGLKVAEFLSETSNNLDKWRKIKNYKTIDEKNLQILKNIKFKNGNVSNLALLMHPSSRKYNLDKRYYKEKKGKEAQIQMIKEIMNLK